METGETEMLKLVIPQFYLCQSLLKCGIPQELMDIYLVRCGASEEQLQELMKSGFVELKEKRYQLAQLGKREYKLQKQKVWF